MSANKFAVFLLLAIAFAITGCSDAPKEEIVINDIPNVSQPSYERKNRQSSYDNPSYRGFYQKKRLRNFFSSYDTVWERMLALYGLPDVDNYRVEQQLRWYLNHPDYIARIQERAAPYMHLILDEIERKNIPGELALLPAVESAFIPEAYSRSAASGLWQFIPSTGRLFGLEQNAWYDGRRDIYASTQAATEYLKDLSENFGGDWFLALASYNYGKGNVGKAISRNETDGMSTDYWSLDLPKETTDYVPRLLAIAKLFANAQEYNIQLSSIPNKPYCEVVNVGSQIDLEKAAELANTPLDHFLKLNPCFKKGTTAPFGPHRLLVPTQHADNFKEKLASLPIDQRVDQRRHDEEILAEKIRQNQRIAQRMREEEDRLEERRKREVIVAKQQRRYAASHPTEQYRVHRGETLSTIARNHGTTVSNLKQINRLARNSVNSGVFLRVPANSNHERRIASRIEAKVGRGNKPNSSGQVYVVKKGDTFFNVSKRFAVSRSTIASWNKISPNGSLRLGQRLVIKGSAQQVASSAPSRLMRYTVKKGDTLMQLSRKFGVSLSDLRKSNPGTAKGLRPGQTVKIVIDNDDQT